MKVFLTIILLAIFTTEFLNFCTNALICSTRSIGRGNRSFIKYRKRYF